MIQFNLLPDVKVAFIKAKKAKRIVIVVAALSVIISLILLTLMISASAYQKHHITELNKVIKTYESGLLGTKDLAKILTIQNQLNSLPALYAERPVTSRLFKYVGATTPTQVSISRLNLDYSTSTLTIDGTADSLESVNRYVDTLKFTTYTVAGSDTKSNAFSQVVLSSFGRDAKAASYSVKYTFDPAIFDATKVVTLNVPKTITTRSETELPGNNTGVFDTGGTK